MSLTAEQVAQLLKPIHPNRVLRDGKGHAHVSQQDTIAHLIRVFGFANFDVDVRYSRLVFEENAVDKKTAKPNPQRWDVCYRSMVRLTIHDPSRGYELCHYEDGSTATALNQTRGDAHDLAFKSSISLAIKRCAKDLGDQFGLSLYNKGQLSALVMGTLVLPGEDTAADSPADMQDGVEPQVAMGNDETDYDGGGS
jgi:recombination DNA repair RAD52 pathway protein